MPILFHKEEREFHLYNEHMSYIIRILPNLQLENLYYGKRVSDKPTYSCLSENVQRPLAVYSGDAANDKISMHHVRQEYPSFGTGDFHYPSFEIAQLNGSGITAFKYQSHSIRKGKRDILPLPSTYVESDGEAETLAIVLYDTVIRTKVTLFYSIYTDASVLCRSALFEHEGDDPITLNRAMSASVDLPDSLFEMVQLSGAWARERSVKKRRLEDGVQSIHSLRGISSAEHNPFIALKRPNADESNGEVYGFSLVYSGNFLAHVEVDSFGCTRVMIGIHPDTFAWVLKKGESFQTPEVVMVYSDSGLNTMSHTYHRLYRTRLARGIWRDETRPIVLNNWESTGSAFTEDKILLMVGKAKELGIELFVLDDGWFGKRDDDTSGLGDWYPNMKKLPEGISGLSRKIEAMGLKFGLWFEPEMANKDSDLYRAHPDWILSTPGRDESLGRNQCVLDFSRAEVVDFIYGSMSKVLRESKISYVKWDMNRYITECYSRASDASSQQSVPHRFILGVYDLYGRLIKEFPHILFESCSSGGARFDPAMLYFAPQVWTSDNTDAITRLKIQYGTSIVYPLSSMGNHVSDVPNQQVGRITPLDTRANVAFFGQLGYELDPEELTEAESDKIRKQIVFYKKHRDLIRTGTFYRLGNPFEENHAAWIVVSENKDEAIAGYYRILNEPNPGTTRFYLAGLDGNARYLVSGKNAEPYCGDELMYAGILISSDDWCSKGDFASVLFYLEKK